MSNGLYHDQNGKFKKDNPGGGRKPREAELERLDLLRKCVTTADAKAIVVKAIEQAKRGDAVARKWLWDYLVGPPPQRFEGPDGGPLAILVDASGLHTVDTQTGPGVCAG